MAYCESYNPDNVFRRFKLMEFPISFVGLSTSLELDVGLDITGSSYLKTMYRGNLLNFDDARNLSASHRAFLIKVINHQTIEITFKPINECISRVRNKVKMFGSRFVFDLRLIKADGLRCCDNEYHSEVGRYYVTGQYEQCEIAHTPEIVDFGEVLMKNKVSRAIRIRNRSKLISANMKYVKTTDLVVSPQEFVIAPHSSKRIVITLRPNCLKAAKIIVFQIKNPHDSFEKPATGDTPLIDTNYLTYKITVQARIIYNGKVKEVVVESLHNIFEPNPKDTFLGEQLIENNNRKELANQFLKFAISKRVPKISDNKNLCTGRVRCYSQDSFQQDLKKTGLNFCKEFRDEVKAADLFNILFTPHIVNFERVALDTYAEQKLTIHNNTEHDIVIRFLQSQCLLYTQKKLPCCAVTLKSRKALTITLACLGYEKGIHSGTFEYAVDNKFFCKHRYCLQVEYPVLWVREQLLKFGMVTSEGFVSSVPVRIINSYNIPVEYEWSDMQMEAPFEVIPKSGRVPQHGCIICDLTFLTKMTKSKSHEMVLFSKGPQTVAIPLEINVMTRKLTVKFLQNLIVFKDIPLNLESIEKVKLENSSREIALFYVVEPLLPGITVEPMQGTLRPKTVMNLVITVKIPCVLEFNFDIFIKVNNKENIGIGVTGNVIEPKLNIFPKNIYMPRIPCGMITYVPVTVQNTGTIKCDLEVMDTGDENIFNVYVSFGNEKKRIYHFSVEGGQSKVVYIKVCDVFRREYEMYVPFKVNGLLGPPNHDSSSIELQYYISHFEREYSSTLKAKVKSVNKDISYCRIAGVITVPWIHFSVEKFEIDYEPNGDNSIEFTMTNVSKYYLYVAVITSKLSPHFSLQILEADSEFFVNDNNIKFEMDRKTQASFCINFHPKGIGRYAAVAIMYLDKAMSMPYSNLTFIGRYQSPAMSSSTYRIIFPPCLAGTQLSRTLTLKYDNKSDLDGFTCSSKEETHINVQFVQCKELKENGEIHTLVEVNISVYSATAYSRNLALVFHHEGGSSCDIEVNFCFTFCPLTLHAYSIVTPETTPFPYYPQENQSEFYNYMETCKKFLERWMFQQGFRRDLYPEIPDTFHAIASAVASTPAKTTKGIGISFLNFMRRIAGPLMKHIHKVAVHSIEEPFKTVKEIHDTYHQIIHLLRSRGANLWLLQAKFLLSHDQFVLLSQLEPPRLNADLLYSEKLINDPELFDRLSKQSWIDLIIQSYKVFILDSCFFECICVSSQQRDIIKVLVDWYNEQILIARFKLFDNNKPTVHIENITKDLRDGVAIISTILNHCPFLEEHFAVMCDVDKDNAESGIIHNACLIIEAMNILRLYFPLTSKDMLNPNYMQMLFLSIHLYVALPMYRTKATVEFNPPLLRSSTRQVVINPMSQETLSFSHFIFGNSKTNFLVEKAPSGENGKKMYLSVKYFAHFVAKQSAILLVHGYNKTRIFDTYIIFHLVGNVGALNPLRKCKLTAPLYRPNRVDVMVHSPFATTASFMVHITDIEPTIPVDFEIPSRRGFYITRLNLMEQEIVLVGSAKESAEVPEHKIFLQMYCLSSQPGNSWIWFRSDIGEFFIKVTTQPRSDIAIETMQIKVDKWPMDPCSCGESCECYRSAILMIPHRNDLMLKALRYALLEHASETMMKIYDKLIDTTTGQIILSMLLAEGGTNIMEVKHILRPENTYRITSKTLMPRIDRTTLRQHSDALLPLPVTLPPLQKSEKFSVTFTSECGFDVRTYRIIFIESCDIE